MNAEIWKPIPNYESSYEVSSLGNIKRKSSFDSRGHLRNERILKTHNHSCGYKIVGLYKDGVERKFLVHTLVADAFIPNNDNLSDVNHINEIKSDNRLENLERCTRSYNCRYGTANERRQLSRKLNKVNCTSGLPINRRIKVCVENF